MSPYAKLAGVWKHVSQIFIKQAGAWKQVKQGWVKSGGIWKQFYAFATTFTAPTTSYIKSSHTESTDYGDVSLAAYSIADHGGILDDLYMKQSYDSSDENSVTGWEYALIYRSSAAAPSYSGNLKVTNTNTGVAIVMSKVSAYYWRYYLANSTGGYPLPPYDNFVRNGATDTFLVEEA